MTTEHMNLLFKNMSEMRKRKKIKPSILKRAFTEVDKIKKISFRKKEYSDIFWGDNPYKENSLVIDLPHIELEAITPVRQDFRKKAVYYDEERVKKEGMKYIDTSCVITYRGEIMIVYITETTDKAITKATERISSLAPKMEAYYPVKENTFYSPFRLTDKDATIKEKQEAYEYKMKGKEARYTGKNWMDGMIRYFQGSKNSAGGTIVAYQPRKVEANDDDEFLFDLVYTYCALYELEKRYAPSIAKYRYELASNAGFIGAFPSVPLERHCATGVGASLDFASSIHNDSGISGLTETIIWNLPEKGMKQYFISPTINLVFDLTKHKAIILQPPKVPHSTLSTGNHKGVGLVNITKANIVAETELNKKWYSIWKRSIGL